MNMLKMFHVNPRGTAVDAMVPDELDMFYKLLDCSCIDIVHRTIGGKPFSIICDDEGTFVADPLISAIDDMGQPMLVGALLVCSAENNDGELVGLTEDEVKHISKYVRKFCTSRHPEGLTMLTQVGY